jgi:transcriptional adapter 2-alpha
VTPSFPILPVAADDFFRELLLIEGIAQQGLGNWQAVAEHVGTRTKEEVEEHYNSVYIDSPNWPRPVWFLSSSPFLTD